MDCKKCGRKIKKDAKFCSFCGEKVSIEKKEKKEKKASKKYCSLCGEKLNEDGVCLSCSSKQNDTLLTILIYIASFVIPFFGLLFYLFTRNQKRERANTCLILFFVRVGAMVLFFALTFLFLFIFLF